MELVLAGEHGTPGAGATCYEYRVDLTQAADYTECLARLVVNFGPVIHLTYPSNQRRTCTSSPRAASAAWASNPPSTGRRRHHFHVQRLPVRRTDQLLFRPGGGERAAGGDRDAVRIRQSALRADHRPHAPALKRTWARPRRTALCRPALTPTQTTPRGPAAVRA